MSRSYFSLRYRRGGNSGGVNPPPAETPPVVSYGAAQVGTQYLEEDVADTTWTPSLTSGSAATAYATDTTPPLGISVHPTTGVITVQPTVSSAAPITFTVTPSNAAGDGTPVAITVHVGRKPTPSYVDSPYSVLVGDVLDIEVQDDDISGLTTYAETAGTLPTGVTVPSSGHVTSTVGGGAASTSATVTGTNPWGTGNATLAFEVTVPAFLPTLSGSDYLYAYVAGVSAEFQDTGKTSPVTAGGQNVDVVEDLAGGPAGDVVKAGSGHVTRVDALGGGPTPGWIMGVNKWMQSGTFTAQDAGRSTQLFLVVKLPSLTDPGSASECWNSNDGGAGLVSFRWNAGPPRMYFYGTANFFAVPDTDLHLVTVRGALFGGAGSAIVTLDGNEEVNSNDQMGAISRAIFGNDNGQGGDVQYGAFIVTQGNPSAHDGGDEGLVVNRLLAYFTTLPNTAPVGLTTSVNDAWVATGVVLAPITVSVAAGTADDFSISPSLPTGLTLHQVMSVWQIDGTPTEIKANPVGGYTLTATNTGTGQSTTARLNLGTFSRFNGGIPDDGDI